jgi:glycosyltransferase involved in cell wall biosynthesis
MRPRVAIDPTTAPNPVGTDRAVANLSVVVLTFNEERNLVSCLESIAGWAAEIFVVDSGSADRTVAIAEQFGAQVTTHAFESHARQWRWTFDNLPIRSDWVLAIDADQLLTPELKADIATKLVLWSNGDGPVGAYLNRRQIFRGRWIRHGGYYPKYLLKLFRRDAVSLDETDLVDHHFSVAGTTVTLAGDLIEDNKNESDISVWIGKHNRYAVLQAREEELRATGELSGVGAFGSPDDRTRFRKQIWYRLPLYFRPLAYFFYRYFVRLGFLDGKEGFTFHFMQAFWYRLLVDINRDEIRRRAHLCASAHTDPLGASALNPISDRKEP